jgi:hypothetical protein
MAVGEKDLTMAHAFFANMGGFVLLKAYREPGSLEVIEYAQLGNTPTENLDHGFADSSVQRIGSGETAGAGYDHGRANTPPRQPHYRKRLLT